MHSLSIEVLLGRVIGLVIGFTLHEWAHAWTAYRLGDNTPYFQRRLTLDPRAHLEPIGILLALVAGFGWAKPVPVNPRAFYPNEKRGIVLVALAGPLMNLIIAFAVGILIRLMTAASIVEARIGLLSSGKLVDIGAGSSGFWTFIYNTLGTIVIFNLVLFLFNLIPLSPLDGYKIAVGTLPPEYSNWLIRYERETMFALMMLILIGAMSMGRLDLLWGILGPPLRFLYGLFTSFYPSFT
ncbi:MAG: site-2 protease family protein [Anaerolineae bacterium]|nr:site-2 protease family protein [Anaerolineae bacterium]